MAVSSYWLPAKPLILASGSKSRSALLTAAGLFHDVMPAQIDERALEQSLERMDGPHIALALARAKAGAVAGENPGRVVLGADQTLSLDEMLLHKPDGVEDARRQLLSMRGKMHSLNSAIAVVKDKEILFQDMVSAKISIRNFSDEFLDDYLAAVGPSVLSSVGCYHVEGHGVHLFEAIEGDQFTIMGLPLLPLLNFFREAGYIRS